MKDWRCQEIFGDKVCDKASDYMYKGKCLCEQHWCEIMDIPYEKKDETKS